LGEKGERKREREKEGEREEEDEFLGGGRCLKGKLCGKLNNTP
jgi:hypothetical protein